MGGAVKVGRHVTSEVRWDQSQLIPLSSQQAPKSYFACSVHCTLFIKCKVYIDNLQCRMYGIRCMVSSVWCTVYGIRCTVYGIRCTVYGVRCTVYGVRSTLY